MKIATHQRWDQSFLQRPYAKFIFGQHMNYLLNLLQDKWIFKALHECRNRE